MTTFYWRFLVISLIIIIQAYWRTFIALSLDFGFLFFHSPSIWPHIASVLSTSKLCGGQSMIDSVPLCVFLITYAFIALWVCLGSFSSWQIKPLQNMVDQNLTVPFCIHNHIIFQELCLTLTFRYGSSAVQSFFKACHFLFSISPLVIQVKLSLRLEIILLLSSNCPVSSNVLRTPCTPWWNIPSFK